MKDPVLNPLHPGKILAEDFLKPLAISQYRLAKVVGKSSLTLLRAFFTE
jgi:plasmid maintenance system antidote protein VapI